MNTPKDGNSGQPSAATQPSAVSVPVPTWTKNCQQGQMSCPQCASVHLQRIATVTEDNRIVHTFHCRRNSCEGSWKVEFSITAVCLVSKNDGREGEWIQLRDLNTPEGA